MKYIIKKIKQENKIDNMSQRTVIKLFKIVLFSTITIFGVTPYQLNAQKSLSLTQALDLGLENSYALRINAKQMEIAENENSWARAGKSPLVNLNMTLPNSMTKNNNPVSFIQGYVYSGNVGGDITAQYNIYNGGRVNATKRSLDLQVETQTNTNKSLITTVSRTIKLAYINTIFADEQRIVLKELIGLSKNRLEYAKVQSDFGRGTAFEIRQIQDAIFTDSINLVIQTLNYENAIRNLNLAMENDQFEDYTLTDKFDIIGELDKGQDFATTMRNSNFELKQLQIEKAIAKANIAIQEATFKPEINIQGSLIAQESWAKLFGKNPNTGESIPFRAGNVITGNIALSMVYRLFDGGVRKQNVKSAELRDQINSLQYQRTLITLNNQLSTLLANYKSQENILELNSGQLTNATSNIDLAAERFKLGLINSIDYRAVQLQYLNSSLQRLNILLNLARIKVEVEDLVN
jgi:outer membrane protein TolC